MTVFWTDSAINQLEDIFNFYKNISDIKTSQKIIEKIIAKTTLLETQPELGQIEELLKERKYEYRYLVENNYKIIYWIEDSYINIAAVFDCRQNPIKIKKTK